MKGSGDTFLQLESSDTLHLNDVLHVPTMKRNRVSISASKDKGYLYSLMGRFLNGTRELIWIQHV